MRRNARQAEVQLLFRLEAELERNDERVVHPRQHQSLRQRMRDLVPVDDMSFPDRLQGVDPLRIPLPDLHHLPEAALPDNRNQLKVVDGERMTLHSTSHEVVRTKEGRRKRVAQRMPDARWW